MAKPALFYAIRRERYGVLPVHIVAVTTEKGRKWYGREIDDERNTNGAERDIYGRFETLDQAQEKLTELREIMKEHRLHIAKADAALRLAIEQRNAAISQAVGRPVRSKSGV